MGASASLVSRTILQEAVVESRTDNIPSGWCGRAVLSILRKSGLGDGLQGGNGQDWEKILMAAGWKPVRCLSPHRAPLGSVLVYVGDRRVGKLPRGTPGGYYGHVELVAMDSYGRRMYVADNARPNPGGSVPDNFTGRAWVPPGRLAAVQGATPPPVEDQVREVMGERFRLAMEHFQRKQREVAAIRPMTASTTVE